MLLPAGSVSLSDLYAGNFYCGDITSVKELSKLNEGFFYLTENHLLRFSDNTVSPLQVEIYSTDGKLVKKQNSDQAANLSELSSGMYVIHYIKDQKKQFQKIIVP